jgi:DNA-binding response OmpR family regulator
MLNPEYDRARTILVADDEPGIRRLVSASIGSDDFQIVEAVDGDEAWRLVLEHRPRVALLDVQMPGRSGLELTSAIKSRPELNGTYVILLSAKAQATDVAAGLAAGADEYITKPFSPLELLIRVEHAVGLGWG